MSADNWATCPRCLHRAQQRVIAEQRRVAEMYGKVPVEEFDAARDSLPPMPDAEDEALQTFEENWDVGIGLQTLIMRYNGQCTTCGLSARVSADEHLWSPDDDPEE